MLCLNRISASNRSDDIPLTTSRAKPRIVIADDHHQMLEEVSRLLKRKFEVVAAVENGVLAVLHVTDLKPDAVVLDIHMPKMGGIEAAKELIRLGSSAKIIFLTIETDPEYVGLATAMGASYVIKGHIHDLTIAIEEALAGRPFVSSL
jgi:DNA-binding NarL/FixJ family response regulator